MDDKIGRIILTMSQVCAALKRELDDFRGRSDRLAFQECRTQTRRFQLYQELFKEKLWPLLVVRPTQGTDQLQQIDHSLSLIQDHVNSLLENATPAQGPGHATRIFHNVKSKRLSALEDLDHQYTSLMRMVNSDFDTRNGDVPETDKAGPDGALSRAMKTCWTHLRNIHKCVMLQPHSCECERHISDLLLHRQEPDEQVGADVIFHWGPRLRDSQVLHMQEARIRHQKSFADHQALPQQRQAQTSKRLVKFADDIVTAIPTQTSTAARTLCRGLESQEPRVVTSNSAGYSVTVSTELSLSTSEETFRSLESILTERPTRTVHSQRLRIAHAIASSHLRLHPTQWLGYRWNSRDIVFAVKDGLPLLEQPYLRRQSLRGATETPNIAVWDDATSTLGILLLELCFNRTIASFAREHQHTQALSALHEEINLAKRWYSELNGRTDDDYDDVVSWCLRTSRMQDIDNEWRQSMQDKVVRPLERLCNNSGSTSLILDFDKAAWALRSKIESLLIVCKGDPEDPIWHALSLKEAYCPDNALEELIRQQSTLLKHVYTASHLCCLSHKGRVDIRAFRMDTTDIHNEADEFYDGIASQKTYQRILGTFILAMTDPPSKAWFKAWDRFTACCRGDQPHLAELMTTDFPLDEDVIVRLFTGQNPAERSLSPINPERADMDTFRSSQYYFCAARLVRNQQLHDHSTNNRHSLRMPFTSIKRIGGGSCADVYRVAIHNGHYEGQDQELAMKVLTVGRKTPDEWRHTAWMMSQLQTHECIMRAKASLRLHQQVLIFYEAAECDLYSYMTNNDPPPWTTRNCMLDTIREIADALNYLHQGLSHKAAAMACLHGDMKAENVLVTWRPDRSMRLKLADFGISTIIHERSLPRGDPSDAHMRYAPREHKTRTGLGEGLHNAAPEMQDNGLVDASADVWAFGTVLADYIAWLFSGRNGLGEFECAKSAGYRDHTYFCIVIDHQERSDSLSKNGTAKKLAQFSLKKEIKDWFESTIRLVREDKSISELDKKMLEDCWWLLESRILVCDANKRGKSEDILLWLGQILKGTFVVPTNPEGSTQPAGEDVTKCVQESVLITTSSSKRERALSSPSPSHKKIRCAHSL